MKKMRHLLASSAALLLFMILLGGCSSDHTEPRYLVVANSNSNNISVLSSLSQEKVMADIALSLDFPWEVTLSEDGYTAYVSCRGTRNGEQPSGISVVDLKEGVEVSTVVLSGIDPSKSVLVDSKLYVAIADNEELEANDKIIIIDVAADPPVEVGVINLSQSGGILSIAASPDGKTLYAGSFWNSPGVDNDGVYIIDRTKCPPVEVSFDLIRLKFIHQLIVHDGILYALGEGNSIIPRLDTETNQWLEPIPTGTDGYLHGAAIEGDTMYLALSQGAVGILDLTTPWDELVTVTTRPGSLFLDLDFEFPFGGENYDAVGMSEHGYLELEQEYVYQGGSHSMIELEDLVGFAPVAETLELDGLVALQARSFGDRAVFQWYSATSGHLATPMSHAIFEVVLFSDGRVRFDYRGHGYLSTFDDHGFEYPYGVSDGDSGAIFYNMREDYGNPNRFESTSFVWNPESPDIATEVPYKWEEIGRNWIVVDGTPHGIALTQDAVVVPLAKIDIKQSGKEGLNARVAFVDKWLHFVNYTVTGLGPRDVAITPPRPRTPETTNLGD